MQRQNKSAKTEEICINNAMTKHCKGNRIFIYKKSAKTRISQKESEELLKKFLYDTHNTGVQRHRIEFKVLQSCFYYHEMELEGLRTKPIHWFVLLA